MPQLTSPKRPKFRFEWKAPHFIESPFGHFLWHIFWAVVIAVAVIYAILNQDFLGVVVSILAFVFFFHPFFHQPQLVKVILNEEGFWVDDHFYPWEDFSGFEFFDNGERLFLFLVPKHFFHPGVHFPIDSEEVDIEELKKILNQFLDEYEGAVGFFEKFYRVFWR